MMKKQHVFLVGAKSLGAYGGYETFINKLTEYHQNKEKISYHVACKANGSGCMKEETLSGVSDIVKDKKGNVKSFVYQNADCFKIHVPNIGPAQAIYYDIKALSECCRIIEHQNIEKPIVYIMACRIGPFAKHYYKRIHALGGKVYINPDGHEWKRAKWNYWVRKYWKWSEYLMVKHSDLLICDSVNIEKYIHKSYDGKCEGGNNPQTTFIAYGAETRNSRLKDDSKVFQEWLAKNELKADNYYLVVGRFVPENNYETMIREFMQSKSKKNFAIITNVNDSFLDELERKLDFRHDSRIKFVGTVYDQELLMKIREKAYGYFHGHEVGGTNPSLLEALGSTKLNLLLNVGFNKEVAEDAAVYWNKERGNLANLIEKADEMPAELRNEYGKKAKQRIKDAYSWAGITDKYYDLFVNGN